MATKQTIAILGATELVGAAIAKKLASGPYRLLLMAENIAALRNVERHILAEYTQAEIELFTCAQEACWEADIIVVIFGELTKTDLCLKISPYATGKTVISMADPASDDVFALQKTLPYSKVISVLKDIADNDHKNENIFVRITGNDVDALNTVANLIETAGFHAIVTENH